MNNTRDNQIEGISIASNKAEHIGNMAKSRNQSTPTNDRTSETSSLVQDYLAGASDLSSTTQNLLNSIAELDAVGNEPLEEFLQNLWYAILHSAKHVSFCDTRSHAKLVDLVKAIRDHRSRGATSFGEDRLELQLLGMCSREEYNDQPEPSTGLSATDIRAWTNLNYFWALLKSENIMPCMFDIWSLRQALEQEHIDDERVTAAQKYDAYVPAAAAWMFGEGKKLYATEIDLTPTDSGQGNPGRGGPLWSGKAEYSKARWAFWKHRFDEISEKPGLSAETTRLAKEAVAAMNQAEK